MVLGRFLGSNNLAAKAQQWANGCVFKHSGGSLGPFGGMLFCAGGRGEPLTFFCSENLASGTGSEYGVSDAFSAWADEACAFSTFFFFFFFFFRIS